MHPFQYVVQHQKWWPNMLWILITVKVENYTVLNEQFVPKAVETSGFVALPRQFELDEWPGIAFLLVVEKPKPSCLFAKLLGFL
ncbi:unnamed protein product [Schistocephalus solidus]|uniref:Uncharacterized protein n=1 Tax=Schistocephalus solidus TaxID=70667 RepID=A0A183TJ21_SCHSO|nr:unnamed protein product [Schistocephalus solidus]